jgi:hypothetical protein
MRTIKINGFELQFDDNCEISIEGDKITVKAKPISTNEIHHWHYPPQPAPFIPFVPPYQPIWIQPKTSGSPLLPTPPIVTYSYNNDAFCGKVATNVVQATPDMQVSWTQ